MKPKDRWPKHGLDLIQLFSDKKDPIDQYVHTHHRKGKSVEDYTQSVQFYNSIQNI